MRTLNLLQAQTLQGQARHFAYNAVDTLGTREIADVLLPRMSPAYDRFYAFERAVQGPAMAMGSRGILVDTIERDKAVKSLRLEMSATVREINKLPELARWDGMEKETGHCDHSSRKDGKHTWAKGEADTPARLCTSCGKSRFKLLPFNPNSPDQTKHLFYDLFKIKKQFNKEGLVSADEDALEKIGRKYPKLKLLADKIIVVRGLKKQIGFLSTRLSPAGRFMSTFNVGTAWTDRWSASKNAFGEGSNAQNIAERHRRMFIADPGKVIVYADLKQAESNIVAHLAGDEEYIEAHRSGDVHTYVTRLVWPDMPWTGDLKFDKKIAKTLPEWDQAPGHDFRFQSKRIQHGSNYGLSPFGIALIAHIPVEQAQRAQQNYFRAFPHIRAWQRWVGEKVKDQETLISPLGRPIKLFGRPWDERTYKQGLSVLPQGTVAHIINLAAWTIWDRYDPKEIQLLAQVHDALLWQQDTGTENLLRDALSAMQIPIPVIDIYGKTRYAEIEAEGAMGFNWGHAGEDNPNGIKEFIL